MQKQGHACYLEAIGGLCEPLRCRLSKLDRDMMDKVQEVRLIAGSPAALLVGGQLITLTDRASVTQKELEQSVITLCRQAVHTYQRQLAQGFVPLSGGHRAGVAATAVYDVQGRLQSVREVNAVVLRVARSILGAADALVSRGFEEGLCGMLIAGAPGTGKTTILRDLARQLSEGTVRGCFRVAVVDERGELWDEDLRCCVLRGYDKGEGILQAVRALSPQVVLCDEIGGQSDVEAVRWALNCGVAVIATIHSRSVRELCSRRAGSELLATGAFSKIAVLQDIPTPGTLKEVVDVDELDSNWRSGDSCGELCAGRHVVGGGISAACL